MSARLLDGKTLAARVTDEVRAGVAERVARGGSVPGLAVVMVGDNAASQVYVRNKRRTTDAVGMRSFAFDPPADVKIRPLEAVLDQARQEPARIGSHAASRARTLQGPHVQQHGRATNTLPR